MKKEFMILDHPWTLFFLASKNPILSFTKTIPLLALFIIMTRDHFQLFSLLYVLMGIIYWSLFEYSVHRWLYHTPFKSPFLKWSLGSLHIFHHKNISDDRILNAGFLLIYPLTFLLLVPVFVLTSFQWEATLNVGLGLVSYYCFYEFIHYGIHYKYYNSGYLGFIQKYHLFHHYSRWDKNFGNTLSFWDKIFGTYDESYKYLKLTENQKKDFLT